MLYTYQQWLEDPALDEASKAELRAITDKKEIENRFFGLMEFGTAGLRGVMGAGIRYMNVYTVRHATQALADYINSQNIPDPTVAIARDSRIMSREFSEAAANVLAANGIKSYLFDNVRPTPELSFSVLELKCIAGINITASHNPKEYNGYKVYWKDGAQISPEQAEAIYGLMKSTDMITGVKTVCDCRAREFITVLGEDYDDRYIGKVLEQSVNPDVIVRHRDLSIIYTPFHGAGFRIVPETLRRAGFENLYPVAEQMVLDGRFPTVKSPNPENKEGFTRAIEIAKERKADLIIGTDPDCDRMGLVVRNSAGDFVTLSGNQTGAILLNYIIKSRKAQGKFPTDAFAVKTIVSTTLVDRICEKEGVHLFSVLTGFKFIGEKINEMAAEGNHSFLFGFEESYGYLAGTYARDKDGVVASLLAAEAAAFYAERNMTLWDALQELFAEYGVHKESTVNLYMQGVDGLKKMQQTMNDFRTVPEKTIGGLKVLSVKDYLDGIDGLPRSNVLSYALEDGSKVLIRPSGTEPKIKIYTLTSAPTAEKAEEKVKAIEKDFLSRIE